MKSIQLKEINKNTVFEQVFLENETGDDFFQGQIDRNDIAIKDRLSDKNLKSGVIPENYYVFFNGCYEQEKTSVSFGAD